MHDFVKTEYDNYLISKDGRVYSEKSKKVLIPLKCSNGYTMVAARVRGKTKYVLIHRLVAKAFIETNSFELDVNHKNGIKNDNRFENLEWCTRAQNMSHSRDVIKTLPTGEKAFQAKITNRDVDMIRALRKSGFYAREIAPKFNISMGHCQSVISGRYRKTGEYSVKPLKLNRSRKRNQLNEIK